jgi:hypothetical protein
MIPASSTDARRLYFPVIFVSRSAQVSPAAVVLGLPRTKSIRVGKLWTTV